MCDHCRSAIARTDNAAVGARMQEKARFSEGTRLEKTVVGEACCARTGKACCGGGCCEGTELISSCCGIKRGGDDETTTVTTAKASRTLRDESQVEIRSRNLMHRPGNSDAPAISTSAVYRIECAGFNFGNCPANPIDTVRGNVAPTFDKGVCPAMMNNLPCTSYREPKCFGGDCCDGDANTKNISKT